ncbi:MAG: hypothetical protein ACI4D6_11585, partial [Chordicoccus sp.]
LEAGQRRKKKEQKKKQKKRTVPYSPARPLQSGQAEGRTKERRKEKKRKREKARQDRLVSLLVLSAHILASGFRVMAYGISACKWYDIVRNRKT